MRYVVLFILVFTFLSCSGDDKESTLRLSTLRIASNSKTLPEQVPSRFYYTDAQIVFSAVQGTLSISEGGLVMKTSDPIDQVEKFYENRFRENGWKIIQTQKGQHDRLIMAESLRRLITVILREESGTVIKLYFRRSYLD